MSEGRRLRSFGRSAASFEAMTSSKEVALVGCLVQPRVTGVELSQRLDDGLRVLDVTPHDDIEVDGRLGWP